MEFTFELGKPILYQLTILDKVLIDLGLPLVFENPDFVINNDTSSTFGLDIKIIRSNRNTIPIFLALEGDGMRIDIDDIPETFEWSNKSMEEPKEVVAFIKQLLTSYVLMEFYSSHTAMCLFDNKGQSVYKTTLRYHSLLGGFSSTFLKRDRKEKLFLPIYPPI